MNPKTALQIAQLTGAIQMSDQVLKVQLDFVDKLQQQRGKLQQQLDQLQGVKQ